MTLRWPCQEHAFAIFFQKKATNIFPKLSWFHVNKINCTWNVTYDLLDLKQAYFFLKSIYICKHVLHDVLIHRCWILFIYLFIFLKSTSQTPIEKKNWFLLIILLKIIIFFSISDGQQYGTGADGAGAYLYGTGADDAGAYLYGAETYGDTSGSYKPSFTSAAAPGKISFTLGDTGYQTDSK